MTTLLYNNKYCKIVDEQDSNFIRQIDKLLSYKLAGAEYMPSYRGWYDKSGKFVRWDGVCHLMNSKLTFFVGLMPKVIEYYKSNEKNINVVYTGNKISQNNPINIDEQLKKLNMIPHDYQMRILDSVKENNRGIIRAATGAGKTLIAAMISAYFGKKTIVYVIGTELLYQFYNLFVSIFGEEKVGIIGNGECKVKDFNIVSIWTAAQALGIDKKKILLDAEEDEKVDVKKYQEVKQIIKEAKVQIWDECHMVAADTSQTIYKNSDPEHIYGLSGTPWRDDNQDLLIEAILGRYIADISASELISKGFLAKPIIKFVPVPKYPEPLGKNYKSVYSSYIVENETRNKLVLDYAIKLKEKGYQTLILFNTIKHGNILYDLISKHLNCALLSGKDEKEIRDDVRHKLENKEIDVIIASRIFDLGVNVPSLSGLILASGGKSSVRALQRIGRVIRKYEGKKNAAVIDFIDDCTYLKNHSRTRYKIYSSEPEFKIFYPKK